MPRPFRLRPPDPLEKDIHAATAAALDRLLMPPAMWCCYPAGAVKLSAAETARLSRMGLKRGLPDIFVFYYGLWGIELKRHGRKLSKTRIGRTRSGAPRIFVGQEETFPQLMATGAFAAIAVCHNVDEVLRQLSHWGIPLRVRMVG
jgi:hypothetical protein